jgi:hypothetical protein
MAWFRASIAFFILLVDCTYGQIGTPSGNTEDLISMPMSPTTQLVMLTRWDYLYGMEIGVAQTGLAGIQNPGIS